jgi:hypothetical protein
MIDQISPKQFHESEGIEPKQQFGPDHPWSPYITIYRMELRDHWKLDF